MLCQGCASLLEDSALEQHIELYSKDNVLRLIGFSLHLHDQILTKLAMLNACYPILKLEQPFDSRPPYRLFVLQKEVRGSTEKYIKIAKDKYSKDIVMRQ